MDLYGTRNALQVYNAFNFAVNLVNHNGFYLLQVSKTNYKIHTILLKNNIIQCILYCFSVYLV